MLDVDTFLTALYVMVDDFCHSRRPQQRRPGPEASLSEARSLPSLSSLAGEFRQRARLLPLRQKPSARCVSHPARPFSVQPARALPC